MSMAEAGFLFGGPYPLLPSPTPFPLLALPLPYFPLPPVSPPLEVGLLNSSYGAWGAL